MKKICYLLITLSSALLFSCASMSTQKKTTKADIKSNVDKYSYAAGSIIAQRMQKDEFPLNYDLFRLGFEDNFFHQESKMSEKEIQDAMTLLSQKIRDLRKDKANKNKLAGEAFLKANSTKEGITVTESGLQYMVLKKGSGTSPKPEDEVKVHYRGTTIDGKEFDSSYQRKEASTFKITSVIKGWQEVLVLMNPGSKYKVFIPSELAYGRRGAGNDILPNSVLIFEIELLEVIPSQKESAEKKAE